MPNKYTAKELSKWLIEKAEEAKDPRIARKMLLENDQRGRSTAMIGKLYFFKYNPLYGYRMTKYDKFPMVVPIERYGNGFLGLNLHYLVPGDRQTLLAEMIQFRDATVINDRTKMNISYRTLQAYSNLQAMSKPCIHRYLFNRCRSRFIQIYPYEFDKAAELPVADWVFNQ